MRIKTEAAFLPPPGIRHASFDSKFKSLVFIPERTQSLPFPSPFMAYAIYKESNDGDDKGMKANRKPEMSKER